MKNKPTIVGVTGGIGSGKSTICKIFEILGCKTYYADDRAKWLMQNDLQLVSGVKSLFGDQAYHGDKLNRKVIAEKAFKDQTLLQKLNMLVHPAVKMDFEKWVTENKSDKILLKEAALLFETGSYKELDKIILVTASEGIRIDRVVKRDPQRTEEEVKDIIGKQMTDKEKEPLADFIIRNDGTHSVIEQVMTIHPKLT
jgi:dephospho-CoA kinase